ncbi:MAG: tetratricopeptide repeat protein [Proteobacteria bacterium]|nr:tetratricopeptide repeat protein [Pseudomonadota bacterium]
MTIDEAMALALEHHRAGRLSDAEAIYRQVLTVVADHADALCLLGSIAHQVGRHGVAIDLIGRAITRNPGVADYHNNRGEALRALGRLDEAVQAYQRALTLRPGCPQTSGNLVAALTQLGRAADAVVIGEAALTDGEVDPVLLNNLGVAYKERSRTGPAIACYERALRRDPDHLDAQLNLCNALRQQGRNDEACARYVGMVARHPDSAPLWRLYLSCLLYCDERDEEFFHAEHRRFGDRFARADAPLATPLHRDRNPARRLRIGILSSDLCDHPAGRSIRAWFAHRDRAAFELTCYAEVLRPDDDTRWFEARSDRWRSTVGMSDRDVVEQIRTDGIDILIVVAGHFDDNRLTIAGWRAAPLQVAASDAATSGLATMDYVLLSPLLDPPGGRERWTERRLHLPSFFTHEPALDAPPVVAPPALTTGRVTFGSFNNPTKITPRVVALWSAVLQRMPEARLLLKCADRYADPAVRERYEALFAAHGIGPDRLELRPRGTPRAEHLGEYGDIDIALDSFPFSGSTTTLEALWMGVPVVSLIGDGMVQRMSASFLHAVGLEWCVAQDADDFVAIAAALAVDLPRLAALRADLRRRVAGSALCDGAGQTRALEANLRAAWRALTPAY